MPLHLSQLEFTEEEKAKIQEFINQSDFTGRMMVLPEQEPAPVSLTIRCGDLSQTFSGRTVEEVLNLLNGLKETTRTAIEA